MLTQLYKWHKVAVLKHATTCSSDDASRALLTLHLQRAGASPATPAAVLCAPRAPSVCSSSTRTPPASPTAAQQAAPKGAEGREQAAVEAPFGVSPKIPTRV